MDDEELRTLERAARTYDGRALAAYAEAVCGELGHAWRRIRVDELPQEVGSVVSLAVLCVRCHASKVFVCYAQPTDVEAEYATVGVRPRHVGVSAYSGLILQVRTLCGANLDVKNPILTAASSHLPPTCGNCARRRDEFKDEARKAASSVRAAIREAADACMPWAPREPDQTIEAALREISETTDSSTTLRCASCGKRGRVLLFEERCPLCDEPLRVAMRTTEY